MIVFDGQVALSPFRLQRLNDRLAVAHPGVQARATAWIYLLDPEPGASLEPARLAEILQASDPGNGQPRTWPAEGAQDAETYCVVPRLGTFSPWSSKATDILRGCGMAVRRVERGMRIAVTGLPANAASRPQVLRELFDPMTESLLSPGESMDTVFEVLPPGPLVRVELGADAGAALAAANSALGLALSADELDYLARHYATLGRDPSDAELMMFAQANSEHCRHKVFNASWEIDGEAAAETLFGMIRNTHRVSPQHTLSAYSDNAAVIEGNIGERFFPAGAQQRFEPHREQIDFAIKVETHNHPTAIAPHPGASTGSGGEIRDEGATGRGAKPKAGLTGFSVSHLRIPGLDRPWERERGLNPRFASALQIMCDGPLGAAAFNNEFGRPALLGYFRSFEHAAGPGLTRGYDKPIMLAGGLAAIRRGHVAKGRMEPGDAVVVLGGPAMLIGLGGGAASSLAGGDSSAELDFSSVQRDNPEMQRRCQEVIDRCWQLGDDNPIRMIHDVGAGGLSNAIPETLNDSGVGGRIELRRIPCADPALSPMQIWCNESQERYVLGLSQASLAGFEAICARERCPYAVVGVATAERRLVVADARTGEHAVDLDLDFLFGKPPRMQRNTSRLPAIAVPPRAAGLALEQALLRVLRHPCVASKSFLVTIGDRTVGGLCARDQMVGPWQVPVADCAVMLDDFDGYAGETMAIGERTPLALLSAPASARMAVGEALTNIAAAPVASLTEVRLSANWMAAASHPGEDAALYDAVRAVGMELCPALGISIPVGKDSLSMQAAWGDERVVAPVSLVVSAFARLDDVRQALTPQLRDDVGPTELLLLDLGAGKNRMGGSILQQVEEALGEEPPDLDDAERFRQWFEALQRAKSRGLLLAYHDRSDGGAIVALLEMAFASRCGLELTLTGGDPLAELFNEELGAVVQVRDADVPAVRALFAEHGLGPDVHALGRPVWSVAGNHESVRISQQGAVIAQWGRSDLHAAWLETSHAIQRLRDNPACADEEREQALDPEDPGLSPVLGFDPAQDLAAPYVARGVRPRVAILREQGVNGQVEMAAAFVRAGFDAFDVHMTDLIEGRVDLAGFEGFVAGGGFSYGDVLGAGRGWATSIRYRPALADRFQGFLADTRKFALGVCNGCQMMAALKSLVTGAGHWPRLERNRSEQYEARLSLVEILPSPSIMLRGMEGSRIPVAVAHGEGRAVFAEDSDQARVLACLKFAANDGAVANRYPANPSGTPGGLAGFTTDDGRVTIMMPHPERVFRTVQMSWHPREWGENSPWMRMFMNARAWVG